MMSMDAGARGDRPPALGWDRTGAPSAGMRGRAVAIRCSDACDVRMHVSTMQTTGVGYSIRGQ